MRFRKTNPGDLPQLKSLWALGFGDTEQEIEAFFAISYPTATGFCAEEDGKVIAAAYALPQEVAWGEKNCRTAYLYAVTTHPDFRKRGICAKLLAYAEKELTKRYFDCLTLVPATDALRSYYASLGFVSQNTAFFDEGGAPEARGVCEVLTPAEYAGLRETVLYDLPHVRLWPVRSSVSGLHVRLLPAGTRQPLRLRLRTSGRRDTRRGRDLAGLFCPSGTVKTASGKAVPRTHRGRQRTICHVQMAFGCAHARCVSCI